MRGRLSAVITAAVTSISFLIPPSALAIALTSSNSDPSGQCTQTVDNASSVSVFKFGSECVVIFKRVGTTSWTVPTGVTKIAALIVAGGGGGGFDVAGGGGAGGLLYYGGESPKTPNGGTLTVTAGSVSILVGDGGAGATSTTTPFGNNATGRGVNGGNSSITLPSTIAHVAIGGGGGNSRNNTNTAQSGGSGGGGGYGNGTPTLGGSGTALQGNAGGRIDSGNQGGAGGGGAGVAGASWNDGVTNTGGGGNGLQYAITGTSTYFAGGGGGGSWAARGGPGGLGGGGDGGNMDNLTCRSNCSSLFASRTGGSGSTNTGGGGGGSGNADGAAPAGKGGSGIVVIRYTGDSSAPIITGPGSATGESSSISIAENSNTVHTFAANETVTWTDSGADSSFFSITSGGVLTITGRNFEAAADSDANNIYIVIITATDSAGNSANQTLSVTITDIDENAYITAPSISGVAYKGVIISLIATINLPGKVQFLFNGKRIPNCLSVSTLGSAPNFSATCQWKPTVMQLNNLTAIITPTDALITQARSPVRQIFIQKRSTKR